MRYEPDAARISHERLNDEVIIINVETGAYYSGSGTFADLWSALVQGAADLEIAQHFAGRHAADSDVILNDVRNVIGQLLVKGLLSEAPDRPCSSALSLPESPRAEWSTPGFAEYTDMWDLIQLDPIHEVSEAGWPFAPPKDAG
jgi:hypothetical protein